MSSESLLANSSEKVRFLIHLLQYGHGIHEKELAYEILAYLAPKKLGRHRFIHEHLDSLTPFLRENYNFQLRSVQGMSVYDTFEYAIRQFKLAPFSDAYLVALLDFALEVEQKEGIGAQAFLAQWEKKREKLAIASPDEVDAIKIMTIHKAKGLEFPIVIFPFANERIYNRREKKMWAPFLSEDVTEFDTVLLNEKEEISEYAYEASLAFEEERQKMELDSLNVLYVALTRAAKALYIITEKKPGPIRGQKINRYSDLFLDYLIQKGYWKDGQSSYQFGSLDHRLNFDEAEAMENVLKYQYSYKDRPDFKLVTKGSMLWDPERKEAVAHGNLIHYILGLIKTPDDLQKALEEVFENGDMTKEERKKVRKTVEGVLSHPDLCHFFGKGQTIYNEWELLKADGSLLRPDRLIVNDRNVSILDYKTGKKNPRHREQIMAYADALNEMGFTIKDKVIIYIGTQITAEFI